MKFRNEEYQITNLNKRKINKDIESTNRMLGGKCKVGKCIKRK